MTEVATAKRGKRLTPAGLAMFSDVSEVDLKVQQHGPRMALHVIASLLLFLTVTGVSAEEPAVQIPNERCLGCHDDDELVDDAGQSLTVHATDLAKSAHADVTCATCHASAAYVRHPRKKLGPVALAACEGCHANDIVGLAQSVHAEPGDQPLTPDTCAGCHDSPHLTTNRARADSPANAVNQTDSCGGCHKAAKRKFRQSAHAKALSSGNKNAPSCASCHSAHAVQPVSNVAWRLKVSNDACGECHETRGESFSDNFHGKMAHLKFGGTAFCADCHQAHDILPAADPLSSVAPANLVATCGRCHEQANANFVKYKPHAAPHDREDDVILWSTMLFMKILIIGVFAFFGAHSILWFIRSLFDRKRGQ